MFKRIVALLISVCFVFEQVGFAQVAPQLPVPGYLTTLMTPDRFRPAQMRSLEFDPATHDLRVFIDKGDARLSASDLKAANARLLEYFQIGVRLPNTAFWVNLRPDTAEQIIDPLLENTDLGRVLLAADLQLKKDLALMTSPDTAEGRAYWTKMYVKAEQLFGGDSIEIPALTRPWIVPGEVVIRQAEGSAYIYKASMKVMLEEDYLRSGASPSLVSPARASDDARFKVLNEYSTQLIRELIIPKLTRQVNASKKYAELRQAYYSLVLAQWYKARFKDARIDSQDISAFVSKQPWDKAVYYRQYKKSFEQGEYKKEEAVSTSSGIVMHQYVSGGANFAEVNYMAINNGSGHGINAGFEKGLSEIKVNVDTMTLISDIDLAADTKARDGGLNKKERQVLRLGTRASIAHAGNVILRYGPLFVLPAAFMAALGNAAPFAALGMPVLAIISWLVADRFVNVRTQAYFKIFELNYKSLEDMSDNAKVRQLLRTGNDKFLNGIWKSYDMTNGDFAIYMATGFLLFAASALGSIPLVLMGVPYLTAIFAVNVVGAFVATYIMRAEVRDPKAEYAQDTSRDGGTVGDVFARIDSDDFAQMSRLASKLGLTDGESTQLRYGLYDIEREGRSELLKSDPAQAIDWLVQDKEELRESFREEADHSRMTPDFTGDINLLRSIKRKIQRVQERDNGELYASMFELSAVRFNQIHKDIIERCQRFGIEVKAWESDFQRVEKILGSLRAAEYGDMVHGGNGRDEAAQIAQWRQVEAELNLNPALVESQVTAKPADVIAAEENAALEQKKAELREEHRKAQLDHIMEVLKTVSFPMQLGPMSKKILADRVGWKNQLYANWETRDFDGPIAVTFDYNDYHQLHINSRAQPLDVVNALINNKELLPDGPGTLEGAAQWWVENQQTIADSKATLIALRAELQAEPVEQANLDEFSARDGGEKQKWDNLIKLASMVIRESNGVVGQDPFEMNGKYEILTMSKIALLHALAAGLSYDAAPWSAKGSYSRKEYEFFLAQTQEPAHREIVRGFAEAVNEVAKNGGVNILPFETNIDHAIAGKEASELDEYAVRLIEALANRHSYKVLYGNFNGIEAFVQWLAYDKMVESMANDLKFRDRVCAAAIALFGSAPAAEVYAAADAEKARKQKNAEIIEQNRKVQLEKIAQVLREMYIPRQNGTTNKVLITDHVGWNDFMSHAWLTKGFESPVEITWNYYKDYDIHIQASAQPLEVLDLLIKGEMFPDGPGSEEGDAEWWVMNQQSLTDAKAKLVALRDELTREPVGQTTLADFTSRDGGIDQGQWELYEVKEGGITTIEWRKPRGALEKVLPGTLMARANDGVITYVGESKEGVAAQAHEYDPSIDTLISEEEKKIEDEVFQGPFGRSMFDGLTSAEEAEAEAAARNRYADRHYGERYEVVNGRLRVEDISRDGGTTRSTMTKSEIEDKKRERTDLYKQYQAEEEKKMWGKVGGQFGRSYFDGLSSSQEDEVKVEALNRVADKLYGPRYEIVNGRIRKEDITRDGGKKVENAFGGIDFRVMPLPMAGGPAAIPAFDMKALQALAANAGIADVDAAWKAIEKDIAKESVPYEQLKGLIAVCCQNGSKNKLQDVSACLAQVLKYEEECAVTTSAQMQEVLQMLEAAA